jgi:hypothetical protein
MTPRVNAAESGRQHTEPQRQRGEAVPTGALIDLLVGLA